MSGENVLTYSVNLVWYDTKEGGSQFSHIVLHNGSVLCPTTLLCSHHRCLRRIRLVTFHVRDTFYRWEYTQQFRPENVLINEKV